MNIKILPFYLIDCMQNIEILIKIIVKFLIIKKSRQNKIKKYNMNIAWSYCNPGNMILEEIIPLNRELTKTKINIRWSKLLF